jgi:hypothetical protein
LGTGGKKTLLNWMGVRPGGENIRVDISGPSNIPYTNTISGQAWNNMAPNTCSG